MAGLAAAASPCELSQTALRAATAAVVARGPNRNRIQKIGGKAMNRSGVSWMCQGLSAPKPSTAPTTSRAAATSPSAARGIVGRASRVPGPAQTRMSGVTVSIPTASPIHQVKPACAQWRPARIPLGMSASSWKIGLISPITGTRAQNTAATRAARSVLRRAEPPQQRGAQQGLGGAAQGGEGRRGQHGGERRASVGQERPLIGQPGAEKDAGRRARPPEQHRRESKAGGGPQQGGAEGPELELQSDAGERIVDDRRRARQDTILERVPAVKFLLRALTFHALSSVFLLLGDY